MSNDFYTEAALFPSIADPLKKKGIKTTTDSVTDLQNSNAVVDISNIKFKEDSAYMDMLASTCKEVNNYGTKLIYIPVTKWNRVGGSIEEGKTPIGAICRFIKRSPTSFKSKFSGFAFIFYNENKESFVLYADEYKASEYNTVISLLKMLTDSIKAGRTYPSSKADDKSPVKDVVDSKEEKEIAKEELQNKKQDLVDAIQAAVEDTDSEEEAWQKLEEDETIRQLIAELDDEDSGKPKIAEARKERIKKLNDEFLDKNVNGRTIKDIISTPKEEKKPKHLKVSSINEEWDDVQFAAFQERYDINKDIFAILQSFSSKSYPISIVDIKVEDTSTNQDYVDTYTVTTEDSNGKRSTLLFDIPKFKGNRFMRLRGNEKVVSGQLLLLPCLKTDEDTVQCVSNYNKIFIRRHGLQGRSYPSVDRLLKTLRKLDKSSKIKVYFGDNKAICSKYELPIDYIDIASEVNRIETPKYSYYFNQDDYYTKFKATKKPGMIPYAISKIDGSIKYYNEEQNKSKDVEGIISFIIATELSVDNDDFLHLYNSIKSAERLNYSEASVLANKIPLAVVIGYAKGMDGLAELCGIKFERIDKRSDYDPDKYNIIKFSDGYLKYPISYSTSMLLNGLSICPTENYSRDDVNRRSMWLDFLDEFGGRLLSDGLDNFEDLFIDPITKEVCEYKGIPSDYYGMLMYANKLLSDNKYNRHTDITGNRYRTNEIVAGYFYKAIAKAYTDYKVQVKRGRKVGISMKRSAVIDGIMQDPMSSDLSILNPLLEIEAANSVSFKGLSGMNSDRSYGLDKRTYDDSMINKLALSTGFAANVGINRQTTIDMDVDGARGYIKTNNSPDDMSVTKSFSMSEAITPFGTTRETI